MNPPMIRAPSPSRDPIAGSTAVTAPVARFRLVVRLVVRLMPSGQVDHVVERLAVVDRDLLHHDIMNPRSRP